VHGGYLSGLRLFVSTLTAWYVPVAQGRVLTGKGEM